MDTYALYINLAGLVVIIFGCLGLVFRVFRHWRKGLLPPGINRARPCDYRVPAGLQTFSAN